jgi:UDP-N-acetylglucosamine acyltransferase
LEGLTTIGNENEFFPFVSIGLKTQDLKWKGGDTFTKMGDRNTIRENVTIHSATGEGESTTIGSGNHILAYCHIAHNCELGNDNIMSSYAALAGHIAVEDDVVISAMAGVHQFCRIGRMSFIGACSKVVQDVPPYMMVDGHPAMTRTINKIGLERKNISNEIQTQLRRAYKIIYRDGLIVSSALEEIEAELGAGAELQHLVNFIRKSERGICRPFKN